MPEPDIWVATLYGELSFHCNLCLKAFQVPEDRSDRGHASLVLEAENAILTHDIAVD